jgi:hypothetical protein
MPRLNDVKMTEDNRLLQAYLDRILATGKVSFARTQVVADLDFAAVTEFWEYELSHSGADEKKAQRLRQGIQRQKLQTEEYRRAVKSGTNDYSTVIAMVRVVGVDGSKIFVHQIPAFVSTDDDVLWLLEHERCHAEIPIPDDVPASFGDPSSVHAALTTIFSATEFEEARCFSHQLRAAQTGTFHLGKQTYNEVLKSYRLIWGVVPDKSGDERTERLVAYLKTEVLLNPYQIPTK